MSDLINRTVIRCASREKKKLPRANKYSPALLRILDGPPPADIACMRARPLRHWTVGDGGP
jgi:hypothetical protein